jgi:hypothetical protein
MLARSTNQEDFRSFLLMIKQALDQRHVVGKPFLLYDQHSAHKTIESMRLMRSHFIPLPVVTYSCSFNSVEALWSVSKAYMSKRVLMLPLHDVHR